MTETEQHPKHRRKKPAAPARPPEPGFAEMLAAPQGSLNKWNGMRLYAMDPTTGQVVVNVGGNQTHNPASLTKLMTFYITCEALKNGTLHLNDTIEISGEKDMRESGCRVRAGKKYTVATLIDFMMTQSDNAAANALGRTIGNNTRKIDPDFNSIDRMNSIALDTLKMTETNFVNCDGYYPTSSGVNRTTAHDMALLMRGIHKKFPNEAEEYLGKSKMQYGSQTYWAHQGLNNPESGLALKDGFRALAKTGYVSVSGHNIDSFITFPDGRSLIVVVMGSDRQSAAFARAVGVPNSVLKREHESVRGSPIRDAIARKLVEELDVSWKPIRVMETEKNPFGGLKEFDTKIVMKQDGTAYRDPLFLNALKQAELHAIKQAGALLNVADNKPVPALPPKPKTTSHERH